MPLPNKKTQNQVLARFRNFSGTEKTLPAVLPYIFIFAGVIGVVASFILMYDKIQILLDPAFKPPCNINPVLSCGSVMKTEQANLLGVPNTVFGLMAFTALTTFGFMLAAGAKVQRWIWVAAELFALVGVLFMHYLFFQGVYRINAICPWCFVIWMITIPTFWYLTLYNLRVGNIRLPRHFTKLDVFLQRHHGNILITWYLVIFAILLTHFWYYWQTLV